MWTRWARYLFLMTWILLQVPGTVVSGLRNKTACYNFRLIIDPPCAATQMLLPTMFALGVSSDVICHNEIVGTSLSQKGPDEIRRCCQQRENDTVTEFCLPAMKNQLTDHYYLDFVKTCTASTKCQLSSPGVVQHTDGEDYVTFTFDCVHKDTVLHIQHDSTHTGQEVYLYNDQHDGDAHANCIAYSHECDSHVIIQLAATRVVSPACQVTFTDGDVSVQVDCKKPPAPSNCSSTMFESKSNYVNMSIFMTVDPGRQEKEFLWIRAKADTGKNVTVECGANIPSDVSLNCPTSTSTTTTTTTTTTKTTVVTTTAAAGTTATATAVTTDTSTSLRTSIHSNGATTLSAFSGNGVSPSITSHHSKTNSPSTRPSQQPKTSSPQGTDTSTATQEPQPSTPSKEVFIIGGSVGGAGLIAVIVTITVCVRRRKRNSSEKTDQKREIMDESQENVYSSIDASNHVCHNRSMSNPIYEATDDYKMEQLHRESCGDEGSGQETVSPYALSGPARPGLSLRRNSWVTQSKLDYYDDILFNDKPGGEDSEERSDVQASDLYAKVNKSQGTNQVTDIYAKVDKSGKIVRGTSGSCADEGEKDDVATMYAKVQK